MGKPVVFALFFLFTITTACMSQKAPTLERYPAASQTKFKQIAQKYRRGPVDSQSVAKDLQQDKVDMSKMPIEDAVMLMLMLIAEDARSDMKLMLEEMKKTQEEKKAMREAKQLLERRSDSLVKLLHNPAHNDSLLIVRAFNENQLKLRQYNAREKEIKDSDDKRAKDKDAAEKHLHSVEQALARLRKHK